MKYKILRDIDYKDLEKEVNSAIEHGGWKPLGGIAIKVRGDGYGVTWFYQAMIREEEEDAS